MNNIMVVQKYLATKENLRTSYDKDTPGKPKNHCTHYWDVSVDESEDDDSENGTTFSDADRGLSSYF